MPVPKKRQSKSKSQTRKSSWKRKALKHMDRISSNKGVFLTKDNLRSYPRPSIAQRALLELQGFDKNTPFKKRRASKASKGFGSKQENMLTNTNKRKPKRNSK